MTSRERVLAALSHRTPDRVPLDLGSTLASTMTEGAHKRMRAYLDLADAPPPEVFSKRSQTVVPDAAILERFSIDLRPLLMGGPELRPDQPQSADAFSDEWGVTWARPHGGHYLALTGPFQQMAEPEVRDLDRHAWPDPLDPGRFRGLRERARALSEAGEFAVILNLGVGPVHQCQFLRGYAEWLEDLLARPAFAEALLDRATEFWLAVTEQAMTLTADLVDAVWFGDDIGTQKAPLLRPDLYRRLIKPRHRRMVEMVKRWGKPVIYHSCGCVYPFLGDLVEIGVDAINPVQVSAAQMEPARLKREFGRHLTFWGGIDTQRVLPWGSREEVREEVRRRLAEMGEGGGYVLCAVHNIQPEVPPENVAAMFEAALEFSAAG